MNIAHVVQKSVRLRNIVARYGGEAFAVILPETDEPGLKIFAERLRRNGERMATLIDLKEVKVTISLGGTFYTPSAGVVEKKAIIDTADRALYESKHNGRNRSTFLKLFN